MGRKITKKILRITLWIIGSFIALDLTLVGLLFVPPIQQKVVDTATSFLSEKWHSRISIGEIYLSPSLRIYARDFAIYDYRDNKMIAVGSVSSRLQGFSVSPVKIALGSSELDHVRVIVRKYKNDESVNIAIWARNFKKKEKKSPFTLTASFMHLKNSYFLFTDDNKRLSQPGNEIDYAFFELKDIDWTLIDFKVVGPDISAYFEHLAFNQYTGFHVLNLTGDFRIQPKGLTLNHAMVLTPNSRLFMDFAFEYGKWKDYADFVNKIKFKVTTLTSTIGMKDITYFAPKLRGMDNSIVMNCQVEGPVNDLIIKNFSARYQEQTYLNGAMELRDITDFKHAFFDAHLPGVDINLNELAMFLLPKGKQIPLPDKIRAMETAQIDFDFTGTLAEFSTQAVINSKSDNLTAALNAHADSNDLIIYDGSIHSKGFNLAQFLPKIGVFGQVVIDAVISGTAADPSTTDHFAQTIEAGIDAQISRFDIKGYPLRQINIDGNYAHHLYDASLSIHDPNCELVLNGKVDRTTAKPHYQVNANIDHINPNQIFAHLPEIDSNATSGMNKFIRYIQQNEYITLSIDSLGFSLFGNNLNEFSGNIYADDITYQQEGKTINTDRIRLLAINDEKSHIYRLTSDMLNLNLSTNYSLNKILSAVLDVGYKYCSHLLPEHEEQVPPQVAEANSDHFLNFEATAYHLTPVLEVFFPKLEIANGTTIQFSTRSNQNDDKILIRTPRLAYNRNICLNNLQLSGNQIDSTELALALDVQEISIGEKGRYSISNFDLATQIKDNLIDFKLDWQNPDMISSLESQLGGQISFPEHRDIKAQINSSAIYVKEYLWKFNTDHLIELKNGRLSFNNVKIEAEQSKISIDGWLNNQSDSLIANIENVDIKLVNKLLEEKNMSVNGMISANVQIRNFQKRRVLFGSVLAKGFVFNDEPFGDLYLSAAVPTGKEVLVQGGIIDPQYFPKDASISTYRYRNFKEQKGITTHLNGQYSIEQKEFQITADVDSLPLGFLSRFLSSFSHEITGNASGKINFVLNKDSMYFDGKAFVKKAKFGIRPLNTIYDITGQTIDFNKEGLAFDHVVLQDRYGNSAILDGHILHQKFKNFKINLGISTKKILVLNTLRQSDTPFYGDGFVSGDISITGDTKKLKFAGKNLKTESGTKFYLPISFADKVSESNVITFKAAPIADTLLDESFDSPQPEPNEMEMDFDFTFDVTPIADIQLDLDLSAFGGSIATKGDGRIHFTYNTKTDVNILGDVNLASGSFMMNFAGIINKKFYLMQGGNVNFGGSLDDINIDVQAMYSTTASLSDLITSDNINLRRTPVRTYLLFNGNLTDPASINFSFDLPNATSDLKTLFYSSIDTNNLQSKTEQFFSLVMLGKFVSTNKSAIASSSIESTGIDILTSTFSTFLSQRLKYVDLNFGYQNSNENNSTQYSVAASTSLFNDRTIIQGYFGYVDDKNQAAANPNYTQFIGDFSIEQKLNQMGTWRVKIFNVTNQDELRYSNNNNPYAQGVAIIYKQDFNNRKDLAESYKRNKKKKKQPQNEDKQ